MERCFNNYELNAITVDSSAKIDVVSTGIDTLPELHLNGALSCEFDGLYRKKSNDKKSVPLVFKPYYTFANNGECDMIVWVNCI